MGGPPRVTSAPHRQLSAARETHARRIRLKRWQDAREAAVVLSAARARFRSPSALGVEAQQRLAGTPSEITGPAAHAASRLGAARLPFQDPTGGAARAIAGSLALAILAGAVASGQLAQFAPVKAFKIARTPQTMVVPVTVPVASPPGRFSGFDVAHVAPSVAPAPLPPREHIAAYEPGGAAPAAARTAAVSVARENSAVAAAPMAGIVAAPDAASVPPPASAEQSEPFRLGLAAPVEGVLPTVVPPPDMGETSSFQCQLESPAALVMLAPPADSDAFGLALAAAAKKQTGEFVVYTDKYRQLAFPMGDVPAMFGVCTDVVIRAYRALGIDLQALIHAARIGSRDPSIAHRRTFTLRRYFASRGASLPVTDFAEDYLPGDIVTYDRPQNRGSRDHIAIVSDVLAPSGRPMIVHNRGWGPQLEDALFVDRITGHYRYRGRTEAVVSVPKQASKVVSEDSKPRAGTKGRYSVLKAVPPVHKRAEAVKAALKARGLHRASGKPATR